MRKRRSTLRQSGAVSVTLILSPAARSALGRPVDEGRVDTLSEAAELLLVGELEQGPKPEPGD
jgi:hypothetical protein